jgi:hypothetical protein
VEWAEWVIELTLECEVVKLEKASVVEADVHLSVINQTEVTEAGWKNIELDFQL